MTLAQAYHYSGAEYLCDRVSSMLGTRINYYCDATYDEFVSLVDGPSVNGVNFQVPEDMQVSLRSGTPLTLKAGSQFMDGERLLALLSYGQENKCEWLKDVQAELSHILLEELTTLENKRNPRAFYHTVLTKVSTNFTEDLVAANADMMFAYFDLKQQELALPGAYDTKGNFIVDKERANEIFRTGIVLE